MEAEILGVLPEHHMWIGKPYHFHHADVDDIMQQLGIVPFTANGIIILSFFFAAWTGILDCTIKQALYGIGAQVYPFLVARLLQRQHIWANTLSISDLFLCLKIWITLIQKFLNNKIFA